MNAPNRTQPDIRSSKEMRDIIKRGKSLVRVPISKSSKPKAEATSSRHGSTVESCRSERTDDMQSMDQIFAKAHEIYHGLRQALEAEHNHEHVCINVETGEFVLGKTVREAHQKFERRFGDVPSWDTKIGAPTCVSFGAGAL